MNKKSFSNKLWLAVFLGAMLIIPTADAFAKEWRRSLPARHQTVRVDHHRYYYHGGRFYRPGFFGFGFFLVRPPVGVIIKVLPAGHRTIIVAGIPYYYYDEVYYRSCPSGYVVVPVPKIITPAKNLTGETVTINLANANGSYTSVTLVKQGNGYIGPQGEYYPGNPTVEQLKALYGK